MTINEEMLYQIERINALIVQYNLNLNLPLSEQDIRFYEKENQVTLPTEYRLFLTQIGNGGVGPFYGVYPLGKVKVDVFLNQEVVEKRLVLCHEGCGYYFSLLCTGLHTGIMVYDHGIEEEAVPYQKLAYGFGVYGVPYTFLDWYEHWLKSGAKTSKDMMREVDQLYSSK
ncbi:hypothetical protein CN918_29985 [Priestia megaterium]|nr:hypothetical protein CN918_29985 [Priestia megaterium]